MSILLPEIDDGVALHRLQSLQRSLDELEFDLEELHSRRRLLQDKQSYLQESKSSFCWRSPSTFQLANRRTGPALEDNLYGVNKMLQSVDSMLHTMLQRHRRLSFSLEIYREIVAPITHIPVEILQEIFCYTITSPFSTPNIHQPPLLLTTICRKWRSIALSTPFIWSSISTTSDWPLQKFQPKPQQSRTDNFFRFAAQRSSPTIPSQPHLWIERAGRTPFHMEITIPKGDYWFGISDPYYHWVVQTSGRWFHLRLTARSINLSLLLSKPMPKLKILELVGVYDRSYDLFMLRTHHAEFDLRPETFSFPWSSLTTLEAPGTWFIVDQFIVILKGSPSLRSCAIKVQDLYTSQESPYLIKSHLNHDSLTTFRIYMNDRESYALRRLLDSLSLTSLATLQVATLRENTRSDWPHQAFVSFAQRSACPLRTLRLTGFSMLPRANLDWRDTKRMTEICTCLPSLELFEFL